MTNRQSKISNGYLRIKFGAINLKKSPTHGFTILNLFAYMISSASPI